MSRGCLSPPSSNCPFDVRSVHLTGHCQVPFQPDFLVEKQAPGNQRNSVDNCSDPTLATCTRPGATSPHPPVLSQAGRRGLTQHPCRWALQVTNNHAHSSAKRVIYWGWQGARDNGTVSYNTDEHSNTKLSPRQPSGEAGG